MVQWLLPKMRLPGLRLDAVGFDYLRDAYTVALSRNGKSVTLVLPTERLELVSTEAPFAVSRLRKQVEGVFGNDEA